MLRACHALRPEGIEWPENDDGFTSFKLEHLSVANGIEHSNAHDAMADVIATIELAKSQSRAAEIVRLLLHYAPQTKADRTD